MEYNLSSSQADRINYDEMIERYARACCDALAHHEVLELKPDEYARSTWELDQDAGTAPETDDPEEAESRFLCAFGGAVRDVQDETRLTLLDL